VGGNALTSTAQLMSVSMVDGVLLDKLDYIGRIIRNDEQPFGGLQVILSGDFFQLPPVDAKRDPKAPKTRFAFEAECWRDLIPAENMLSLTRVFRQKENSFVDVLESMRKGICLPKHAKLLAACDRLVLYGDGVEPVGL
jgi:ATP-dependent DNA helicase PIF1